MSDGILLEKMAARYSNDLVNVLSKNGDRIDIVTVEVNGANKSELVFLNDPTVGRLDEHPLFGSLLASATADGQNWLHGLLTADTINLAQNSKEKLLGNVDVATVHANSALPGIENKAYFDTVMASTGMVMSALHSNIKAMMVEMTPGNVAAIKDGMDVGTGAAAVAADAAIRGFWKAFGYEVLEDVPSRVKWMFTGNYGYPKPAFDSTFWKAESGGWYLMGASAGASGPVAVHDLHRAGVDYLPVFFLVRNSELGTAYSASGSDLIGFHMFVPVMRRSRATIPYVSMRYGFNSETYEVMSRQSPLYVTGAFSMDCSYEKFVNVPEQYRTDLLGRILTADKFTLAWSKPASAPALEALRNSGMTKLVPLLAPPGSSFFLHRGQVLSTSESSSVVKATLAGEERDVTVSSTLVSFHAERTYSAITTDWYEQYLATGFGQFKGKGADYAIEKSAALGDAQGLVHTAVFFDTTMNIPTSIVTRTTTYLEYKKAKEKACETNDFMKQKYNTRYTWGEVNSLCDNKGSVSVLYGYRDTLPSAVIVPERPTDKVYTVSKSANPWTVTVSVNGSEPIAVEYQDGGLFGDVVGGATIVGATLTELKTNWQMSDASIQAASDEASGMSADWQNSLNGAYKGTNRAVHDYGWESTAISGFPDVRALGVQAGFRAIIVSVASVGMVTSRLHQAYLNFASRSRLNAIIQ